jgi:hypothetical protein
MSQSYQPQYEGQDDDAIVLSLGEGTTGGLASNMYAPPPEGTHRWQVVKVEKAYTKDSEVMVNVDCQIVESNIPGAMGMTHTERLVIPGAMRFQSDHESWEKMMRFLRLKLEGITGQPWRQDNIPLSPNRDLMGRVFIARCYHVQSDPVAQSDGSTRTFVNSKLADWTAPGLQQGAPNPAQGTLVSQAAPPTLGQVMQPQQPAPSINLAQQAPPQTLEQAAQAMAPPATPGPIAQMPQQQAAVQAAEQAQIAAEPTQLGGVMVPPETQTITPQNVQTVPASMLQPAQMNPQDVSPSPAGQVPVGEPEQGAPNLGGFGGMTFPTDQTTPGAQEAPPNGGNTPS